MKLCECGCGGEAPIAKVTCVSKGYVKGQQTRFIAGHHMRLPEYRRTGAEVTSQAAAARSAKCKLRRRWRLGQTFGALSSREQAIIAAISHREYSRGFNAGKRSVGKVAA